MVSLLEVQESLLVRTYLEKANDYTGLHGMIEHGPRHAKVCSDTGRALMAKLGYGETDMELAAVAGFFHDIGWLVNQQDHAMAGAMLAHQILKDLKADPSEIAAVISAVGGHQGVNPRPVSTVSAALILADNSDIHRSRIRKAKDAEFDEVDNLHASTQSSALVVDQRQRTITLELTVDEERYSVNNYFNLFLPRVKAMRTSAEALNSPFRLVVNKSRLL